jgi:hypothetical protein
LAYSPPDFRDAEIARLREENAALKAQKAAITEAAIADVVAAAARVAEAERLLIDAVKAASDAEAQVKTLREALERTPCKCSSSPIPICPICGGALEAVVYRGGPLNEEQWASIRAGDWYCKVCSSNKSATGFEYFWDKDIQHRKDTCHRCAALAATEPK